MSGGKKIRVELFQRKRANCRSSAVEEASGWGIFFMWEIQISLQRAEPVS